jgi:hypothetical protein
MLYDLFYDNHTAPVLVKLDPIDHRHGFLDEGFLNYNHRGVERNGEWITIYASEKDIEAAFQLYDQVAEPQELNLSPFVYEVYKQVIVPLAEEKLLNNDLVLGPTKVEICRKFLDVFGRPLQRVILDRDILPALEAASLISIESHPQDRRLKIVKPVAIEGLYEETEGNVTLHGGADLNGGIGLSSLTPPCNVTFLEDLSSPYTMTAPKLLLALERLLDMINAKTANMPRGRMRAAQILLKYADILSGRQEQW